MLARHFLIGAMALATLPSASGQQMSEPTVRLLLAAAPFSDEITSLWVTAFSEGTNSPAFIAVKIHGQYGTGNPKRLSLQAIQAWPLRADGTAVAAMPKSFHDRPTKGDVDTDAILFDFVSVPPRDLAGIVVSLNGKLCVREIKATSAP